MSRKPRPSLVRTFGAPAIIAAASMVGLVSALLGDGLNNWISWIGLAVPVAAIVWAWLRRA
ncbi:MAG TPA: hypothetical protein VM471_08660 [Phenylobacterium sp.]|jgi:hypothetical protein|nr:hypothetical protein [Phenylobacterium sp.]